ncbi:MAG TPA: hypothetical protein DDZ96_13955 [Porphyromonadaceae bacterium]|jgi:hypothetical protein|uniref:DUF6261 family protein n=1 Tax=Limibacterium fermenti TaxID=3229863 RepID=UPI000E8EE4F5|nr:hypothetical protein [Porphyromonadaceae bacterium]HCM19812.1 hypothetical protein [Porphyromonadaceae bacterium]
MLVKTTKLSKVFLMEFFHLMKVIADYLHKEDMEVLKLTAVATSFFLAFDKLDVAVKQADKSKFTAPKKESDDLRDNTLVGLSSTIRAAMRYPDADISESSRLLLIVVEKYGKDIQNMSRERETSILYNLVADMRLPENTARMAKITPLAWIDKLDEENKGYEANHILGTEEKTEYVTGLTTQARTEMQAAFEKLCEAINSYAFVDGVEPYKTLADKINVEVAEAQQQAKFHKTLLENKAKGKDKKQ